MLDEEKDRSTSVAATTAAAATNPVLPAVLGPFPHNLPHLLKIVRDQHGKAYSIGSGAGNGRALPVGGKQLNNIIRDTARSEGITIRKSDIAEINALLQAHAETHGPNRDVWSRIAPYAGGIEIDLGDDNHTRVRITAGNVEIINAGSTTLFYRPPAALPMAMPAAVGDVNLIKKYLNLHPVSMMFLIAWLSYTLAHPKVATSKFVILVLQGNEGSGKSALCRYIIQPLIDPNRIGVQRAPRNDKDFAIATQNTHVLCIDNVRDIQSTMADMYCIAATGGALTARQLYTDAEQQVHDVHAALVLNGKHSFIDQPDLSQRCLALQMLTMTEGKRKSETQMAVELQADLPAILRGLFDLIAQVFKYLPTAEVTNPERMLDFVSWLAAMESAAGVRAGNYQALYSDVLNQGQLESLSENLLAAAILELVEAEISSSWSGAPSELLAKLNARATRGTLRSRDWPLNAISLSKRLVPLQASLLTQGIRVDLHRGKHRTVSIQKMGGHND